MRRSCTFLLGMLFLGMITELALAQPATLKPGDGRADGKQSLGGSSEMIEFTSRDRLGADKVSGTHFGHIDARKSFFGS